MSREIVPHRAKAGRKFALASSPSRALPVRGGVVPRDWSRPEGASVFNPLGVIMLPSPFERQVHGADQREAIACCRCFQAFLYLLSGMCSSERRGAVQGALKGAAKRP